MFQDEYDDEDAEFESYPPDAKTQVVKALLLERFRQSPRSVYYQRQLEVLYEKDFFHWVTDRAIKELEDAGMVSVNYYPIAVGAHNDKLKVIASSGNRYYKRPAKKMARIVEEYCSPDITRDVGLIGQELFKVAYARYGYALKKEDAREFNGRTWEKSKKDLDFIVEKRGKYFGCEVKNTLGYIEKKELDEKLEMCGYFGVIPIFILRSSPTVWNDEIIRKGGYVQVFDTQIFPPGRKRLVDKMKGELGLPVLTSERIPDSIMERLEKTMEKHVFSK